MKVDSGGATICRFAYDGDGTRRKRLDTQGTIHYVGPYERNVGNGISTTGVVTKYYVARFGPVSRVIAFRRAGVLYWVGTDHLGSMVRVADASFNAVDGMRYLAFGGSRDSGTSLQTDHKFTLQIEDQIVGLYWYHSRAFDPSIGRFIQPDSLVPQPGNPQTLNRYSYALNNPLKYSDPDGHWVHILIGAAIGAGIAYGIQVAGNVHDNGLSVQAFTNVDLRTVAAGAVVGGVGAATFGVSLAVAGAATGVNVATASAASVGVSAVAGVASGRAAQVAGNAVLGEALDEGLWDPGTIAIDAVTGGAGPALRAARGQVAPFVKGRIGRHMNSAIGELVTKPDFLAASPASQGTHIHSLTADRMRAEGIRGLDIEHKFLDPVTGLRPRVDYRFSPEHVLYDIKPAGADFRQSDNYLRLSGYSRLERIDYNPWWR